MIAVFRAVIMGALFVMFMPFVGFVVVLLAIAERCRGLLKEAPPTRVE